MSKHVNISREELRKQRDEELATHRPFPLITFDEWRARERRARIPLAFAALGLLGVVMAAILFLGGLINQNLWWSLLAIPAIPAVFLFGFVLPISILHRRYQLCCPYCRTAYVPGHGQTKYERNRLYDDGGRCSKCQRMIFTDWALESGWDEIGEDAARRRWAGRWYSLSTWVALAVLAFYACFIFWRPYVQIAMNMTGADALMFLSAVGIATALWAAAMIVRVHGERRYLVWTAVRYAVITLGVSWFAVTLIAFNANPKRGLERFGQRMKQQVDVSAIRSWTNAYEPSAEDKPTPNGTAFTIGSDRWPDSVRRLNPTTLLYLPAKKRSLLVFEEKHVRWFFTVAPSGAGPTDKDRTVLLGDGVWVGW